jgi:hypothetical protein
MTLESGLYDNVLADFLSNEEKYKEWFSQHGDQVYLSWFLKGEFYLFENTLPELKIGSYKFDILGEGQVNNRKPQPLEKFDIVNFHGKPKPWDVKLDWIDECLK